MLNELDRQRFLNETFTREKIILVKLLDLKKNLYHSNPKYRKHYIKQLYKLRPKLIKYEKKQLIFKSENNIY